MCAARTAGLETATNPGDELHGPWRHLAIDRHDPLRVANRSEVLVERHPGAFGEHFPNLFGGLGPHPPQTFLHGSHQTLGTVPMVLQPAVLCRETHRREEFRTEHLTRPLPACACPQ